MWDHVDSTRKESTVDYTVTEVQSKKVTRTYNLSGPQFESIDSFWKWLVSHNEIESYTIEEAK